MQKTGGPDAYARDRARPRGPRSRLSPLWLALAAVWGGLFLQPSVLPPASAQSRDQEEARRAREAGQILDYGRIRRQALKAVPGRVVDQKLRRRGGGRYVYRLKVLRPNGKVAIVLVDAHTGRVLAVRDR